MANNSFENYGKHELEGYRAEIVSLSADARSGRLQSGVFTVGSTVGTIDIPAWATGVIIRPESNNIRIAIDENPVAAGDDELTVGSTCYGDEDRVRNIFPGESELRTLRIGDTDVETYVEFFGG